MYLPAGGTTDIVGLNLPAFFVRTPEDLLAFNEARRPDPATGQLDMEKVGAFLAAHPETVPAVTAAITAPMPESYARLIYHGIHAFRFVAADGSARHARWHLVPDDGEASISDDEGADPDYLQQELADRLANGPAGFHLELELAEADDPVDDPTAAWPEGRTRVPIARLEITGLAFDRDRDGDILVFDPTRVPTASSSPPTPSSTPARAPTGCRWRGAPPRDELACRQAMWPSPVCARRSPSSSARLSTLSSTSSR